MSAAPDSETGEDRQRSQFMLIYALAAAGAVAQYAVTLETILLGCVLLWVCVLLLNRQKKAAQGTAFESHAKWITRTLYIGSVYLLPVATVIIFYFIYKDTHLAALQQNIVMNITTGRITTLAGLERIVQNYIHQYGGTILRITYICITPPILWWLWRCWTGFRRAAKSEPMNKPMAFL